MSASERLIAARDAVEEFTQLADDGGGLVDELLDAYAHELAEKIRTELPETVKESLGGGIWTITTVPTAKQAADLIDPESGE